MKRALKIIFSALFVLAVSFLVVRGCVQRKPVAEVFQFQLGGNRPAPKKIIRQIPVGAPRRGALPQHVPAVPARRARMAIVLDDWGNNYGVLKYALEVKRPLTLAILPHLPNSRRIAEEAYKNRLGVMLHMPMQPKNPKEILEPHTILTTTPDTDIVRYLESAIAGIPHLEGVNNHMGSAATADERVMRTVLTELKKKKLFFVDSNTSADSVAADVAEKLGVPSEKRDVFIDNELKSGSIKRQLNEAKDFALATGSVVVIGHDYKVTLEAIKEMVPELEKEGIEFVLVKDLLK